MRLFFCHSKVLFCMKNRLVYNVKILEEIEKLEDNWNGYNAKPINKKVIENTKELLYKLDKQPEIFPTGRETIQIEYKLDSDSHLEFEIFPNEIKMMHLPKGDYKNAKFTKFKIEDVERINKLIKRFYREG